MRFVAVFAAAFLLLTALYLLTYRVVDPDSEYGTGKFPPPLANARATKQKMFEDYAAAGKVQGLILGSSRAMELEPAQAQKLTGYRFFNFSVQNAMAEDYLAIYRWVLQHGSDPRMVVVGVDVEAFDPADKIDARLLHNEPMATALNGSPPSGLKKLYNALTRASDELNIEDALGIAQGLKLKLKPAKETDVVEPDGHTDYPYDEEDIRTGKFNLREAISASVPSYVGTYGDMDRLSPKRKRWMEDLVHEAAAHHARLILWVPPMHPERVVALDKGMPYTARLKDTVAFVQSLQAQYPATVKAVDLSAPSKFGGNLTDWRDGAHMNWRNGELALATMLGAQSSAPSPASSIARPALRNPRPKNGF